MSDGLKSYRSYQLDKSIIKLSWSTIVLASVFTACIFVLIPFLKTKSTPPQELKITRIDNITFEKPQQKTTSKKSPAKQKTAKSAPAQSTKSIALPTPPSSATFSKPTPQLKVNFAPQAPALASFKAQMPQFKTLAPPSTSLSKSPVSVASQATKFSTSSETGQSKSIDYSGTFSESDLDNDLNLNYRANPKYPRMAIRRNIEATVKCSFIINTTGQVESIKVLETVPAGHESLFKSACERALRKWKFKPNMINGRPVRVKVFQELEFKLK